MHIARKPHCLSPHQGFIPRYDLQAPLISRYREVKAVLTHCDPTAEENDDAFIDELAAQGIAYVPFFPLGGFTPLQSSTLNSIAASLQATPMQVALAWLLQRSSNILLIPGTSSLKHLRENLQAATIQLPVEVFGKLDSIAGCQRNTSIMPGRQHYMKPTAQDEIKEVCFQLLQETFEGPAPDGGSAFLNKGTGLFQTLGEVTEDAASRQLRPEGSSVAAHTEHVRFYVNVHYNLLRGLHEDIDWEESWRIKSVGAEEWEDLKKRCRQAYTTFTEHLRTIDVWREDEIGLTTSVIAHTAYHLGAIRQLIVAQNS